jgi:hypothetical protein
MRNILFSAIANLLPALALLVPIGSVLFQTRAFIQPTPAEVLAFMAGALLAGLFSGVFFIVRCNTNPFQEARYD